VKSCRLCGNAARWGTTCDGCRARSNASASAARAVERRTGTPVDPLEVETPFGRFDATPFVEWFDRVAAAIGQERLLRELGWNESGARRVHRWRTGEKCQDPLMLVDACHMAGISFDTLFDGERYAKLREYVHAPGDAPTGREWTARQKLGKPIGVHGKMTPEQIRAAHMLHMRQQLSIRELGRMLWERFGYASPRACANSLSNQFKVHGLAARDRLEATVLASTVHGLSTREGKRNYTREFAAHRNALRRAGAPLCAGVRTQYPRKGAPCQNRAMIGSIYCRGHEPALDEERRALLEMARSRLGLQSEESAAA
jgi:hypothetical protein